MIRQSCSFLFVHNSSAIEISPSHVLQLPTFARQRSHVILQQNWDTMQRGALSTPSPLSIKRRGLLERRRVCFNHRAKFWAFEVDLVDAREVCLG